MFSNDYYRCGFIPPSSINFLNHRQESVAFSTGVKDTGFPIKASGMTYDNPCSKLLHGLAPALPGWAYDMCSVN